MERRNSSLMITLPQNVKDKLRKRAAEANLRDLSKVTSAAQIAAQIVCAAMEADVDSVESE